MGWQVVRSTGRLTEWEREDGHATLRLRPGTDGSWVVRADRLVQAPEGDGYRRETVPSREAAEAVVERWQRTFDVDAAPESGSDP
jgi:hypothetical protein